MADRRKPLGPPVQWSEDDLLAMSDITPADLLAERARVRDILPPRLQIEDDSGRPYTLRDPAALLDAGEDAPL